MGLANDFAVVRDRIRRDGLGFTLRRIRDVIHERIRPPWEFLYCIAARDVLVIDPPANARLEVVMRPDDLPASGWSDLARSLGEDTMPRFRERLERGVELHILWVDDCVAGTQFIIWGRVHPFQHIPLTERDVMNLDMRIDPDFRGRGLAPLLYSLSIQDLARRGCERQWILVAQHNVRAIKTAERIGCKRVLSLRNTRRGSQFDQDIVR